MIFYLRWYNVIRWSSHICKRSSFLSFYSFLVKFSEWHRGSGGVKLTKLHGVKSAIKQVTYFLNGLMFNLLFYCHIILYWEKVTFYEKCCHNPIEILKNSWIPKISLKMKNCNTFYETQTASCLKKFIQPPPPPPQPPYHQMKSYYAFETKIFLRRYTEIYRHLLSKCFTNVVLVCQEMVQCKCFWHQTETCLLENLQTEKSFNCVLGAYYFQFQKSRGS